MSDLDFLTGVTPEKVTFQKSSRGRQPGKNPAEPFVVQSHESGEALAVEVPAHKAHGFERALRRAAKNSTGRDWKMSVQVLKVHPSKATPSDVIALRELPNLAEGTDVWVSFQATDKDAEDKAADAATETTTPDAPADPFAATPDAGTGETNGDAAKVSGKPSTRKAVRNA